MAFILHISIAALVIIFMYYLAAIV